MIAIVRVAKWLVCGAIILLATTTLATQTPLVRRLTASSGYLEKVSNSNEALVHAPLSTMQLYSKLFDVVTADSERTPMRMVAVALDAPLSYWLSNSLFVPFHEFGHARVFRATGGTYRYLSMAYGHTFTATNYWSLSALRLFTPPFFVPGTGSAAAAGRLFVAKEQSDSLVSYVGKEPTLAILSGAGLNNQMFLAKKIASMVYEKNGHFTYLQHYVGNKISGFVYAGFDQDNNPNNDPKVNEASDPGSILHAYKNMGILANHRDLKMLSLLSLLSGTTASLLKGYYDYLVHGDPVVKPIEIFGVRLPELNGYINGHGLSFEIESDYRIAPYCTAGLAYEFVFKGRTNHNVTPRGQFNLAHIWPRLNEFWLKGDVVIGKGVGGSIKGDYAPFVINQQDFWSRLAYSLDMTVYNADTLYGERNIPSVQFSRIAPEILFGISMQY